MWDRAGLKFMAKEQLRQYYWMAFAVCLVGGILGGSGVGGGGGGGGGSASFSSGSSSELASGSSYRNLEPAVVTIILIVILVFVVLAIAYAIFVANPISVGISTWFIAAPRGYRDFGLLFSSFQRGRYLSIVKTMFMVNLSVFLWWLLFIIPGIIKSYQYRMVPYIISDHPYLTPDEAKEISKAMTDGQKLDMWVLDLSFIGWYLLGTLALIVGVLFVTPYVESTWAQLYYVQRQRVVIPPPPPVGYQY